MEKVRALKDNTKIVEKFYGCDIHTGVYGNIRWFEVLNHNHVVDTFDDYTDAIKLFKFISN